MHADHELTLELIRARLGSTATRARRVHYEFEGLLDRDSGDLELWFGDDVLWFRCAPNGQDLRVEQHHWKDPFAPPLTPENEAFVQKSGKHVAEDVSEASPYCALFEHPLDSVEPIVDEWQHLVGVRLRAGTGSLRIVVDGDELFVTPD